MWLFKRAPRAVIKAAPKQDAALQKLDAFLRAKEPELVRLLNHFWGDQQAAVTYKELIAAYQSGYAEQIQQWQEDYAVLVNTKLAPAWRSAMRAAAVEREKQYGKYYNDSDYYVKDWIGRHGAQFVTQIGEEQRRAVQNIIMHAQEQGWGAEKTSRALRPLIGLNAQQAVANARYREHVEKTLLEAHPRMKPESAAKKAEAAALKYAAQQHRQRAYMIATTELAMAYNRGAHESVRQAQAAGLMGPVIKRWSTAFDERVCPRCGALDGKEIGMDEGFDFGGKKELFPGQHQTPPAHPRCRCAVEYEETDAPDPVALQMQQMEIDIGAIKAKQDKITIKTYDGIWKDSVNTLQWPEKKGSIAAKREYFQEKINAGENTDKFTALIKLLDEFDHDGRAYYDLQSQIAALESKLASLQKYGRIVDDPYSQQRKDAAYWFKKTEDADAVLRGKCGEVWQGATKAQREAIYDYTSGSGSFNRPLSGFKKPYYSPGSGWEKKYFEGVGKVWINYEGKGSKIRGMTRLIERSIYDFDIWLQRGCEHDAMESFFGVDVENMTEEELQEFVKDGYHNRIWSFVSTSVNKGAGFASKPVILNIYALRGTPFMYAEPFSAYGNGDGKSWNGVAGQNSFGSEAEAIIQRGSMFRVIKIEKSGGKLYIDMEVVVEDSADTLQQTGAWKGSKEKYK